jgi:trans-aconitate 2-methyltransferase
VDLGCGPGNITNLLADRWQAAAVTGLDSSAEMIAAARATGSTVTYDVADLRDWLAGPLGSANPAEPVDVLVSNATLQWIPGHLDLLPALVSRVGAGGWLAFQVPGNFDEPSHTICTELAALEKYAGHTSGVAVPSSHDAATYLERLVALGCRVDAWETTYLHVLHGEDPVFTWVSGTGARPTLQALPPGCARSSRPSSRRGCVRRTRTRATASYSRSGGSSWSPMCRPALDPPLHENRSTRGDRR